MQRLPEWPDGTVGLLTTVSADGEPHAIPVSTIVRDGDDRVLFVLGSSRGSLARLRAQPRVALALLHEGDVACTVHGRAHVAADPLPGAGNVAGVVVTVDRIQDHSRPTFEILAGVAWEWRDEQARERDRTVRQALRALASAPCD